MSEEEKRKERRDKKLKCKDCGIYEGLTRDLPYCGACAVKHYGLKPPKK